MYRNVIHSPERSSFQPGGEYTDPDALKAMMDEAGPETRGMHFHFGSFGLSGLADAEQSARLGC